eukprot:m.247278 g.247278  ORF g.247278 m.247278 type:complete len:125 (-) comp10968_c3_seq50:179-553(-)
MDSEGDGKAAGSGTATDANALEAHQHHCSGALAIGARYQQQQHHQEVQCAGDSGLYCAGEGDALTGDGPCVRGGEKEKSNGALMVTAAACGQRLSDLGGGQGLEDMLETGTAGAVQVTQCRGRA